MQDQLISIEAARVAREKGFSEPAFYHWEQGLNDFDAGLFESGQLLRNSDLMPAYVEKGRPYGKWSAPSQSFLQKWLREAHQLL